MEILKKNIPQVYFRHRVDCLHWFRLNISCLSKRPHVYQRFLLWVYETEGGADIGDLNGAVAVGGEGDRVGLCGLRHGGGCWKRLNDRGKEDCFKFVIIILLYMFFLILFSFNEQL